MITGLKQKGIKFKPRIKLNHNYNTFNPFRRKKHFHVVHWSGPEDDSIFIRTHSYNRLKKIFISWNDKFYCTLMKMIWTQKILHIYETILAHFCFDLRQKWNNRSANFFLFFNIATILSFAFDNWIIWQLLQNY